MTPVAPSNAMLWPAALLLATSAGSYVLACAAPFAALAAVAAVTLSARQALAVVAAAWIANQAIGFGVLAYPVTLDSALWGLAIGAGALAATGASIAVARALLRGAAGPAGVAVAAGVAGVAAFAIYEAGLYAVTFALGGEEAFTGEIVGRLALTNLAWLAGLLVLAGSLRWAQANVGRSGSTAAPHPNA